MGVLAAYFLQNIENCIYVALSANMGLCMYCTYTREPISTCTQSPNTAAVLILGGAGRGQSSHSPVATWG